MVLEEVMVEQAGIELRIKMSVGLFVLRVSPFFLFFFANFSHQVDLRACLEFSRFFDFSNLLLFTLPSMNCVFGIDKNL